MKGLFIINPSSGRQNFIDKIKDIAGMLVIDQICNTIDVFYTEKQDDALNKAAALEKGQYDFVVAVGGDGFFLPKNLFSTGASNQLSKSSNKFSPKILGIIISHCSFQTLLLSSANRKHLSFDYVEMIFLNFGLELFFLSLYVLSFVLAVI